jgi:hypothetical protein
MSAGRISSIVLICSVASCGSITLLAKIAHAGDCLVAPGPAIPGSHWYYRTERATQKKCWHLGDAGQVSNAAASQIASQTLETLMTSLSEPVATAKNGLSQEEVQTLYSQFLEWKRRTGR